MCESSIFYKILFAICIVLGGHGVRAALVLQPLPQQQELPDCGQTSGICAGVCDIKDVITCEAPGLDEHGKEKIGYAQFAIRGGTTKQGQVANQVGMGRGYSLANPNPSKPDALPVFVGFMGNASAGVMFAGEKGKKITIACHKCGGSSSVDPNTLGNGCPDTTNTNYCVTCDRDTVPCNMIFDSVRVFNAAGGLYGVGNTNANKLGFVSAEAIAKLNANKAAQDTSLTGYKTSVASWK